MTIICSSRITRFPQSLKKLMWSLLFLVMSVFSTPWLGQAADVHQVTTHPALEYFPAPSQDGRFLAFVSERSGNADIWLKSLSLGVVSLPRQLTTHPAVDRDPSLNAEGSQLLYISHKSDPRGDVYLMNLTTGEEQRLTGLGTADSLPQWGEDGNSILYLSQDVATGVQTLKRRAVASDQATTLLSNVSAYSIGPDGWIVVSQNGALFLFNEQAPDRVKSLDVSSGLNMCVFGVEHVVGDKWRSLCGLDPLRARYQ